MKLIRSIQLAIIAALFIFPYNIYSESEKTKSFFDTQNGQISITSVSYELDMKNSVVVFNEDVNVAGNDLNMSCQKLELNFKNSFDEDSAENNQYNIDKITASGSVVINQPDGGRATAEKAVYFHDSEKIVLTGNPYFKDGDRIEGGGGNIIITLYLKEDRCVVEGTKDDKPRLLINGKDERE